MRTLRITGALVSLQQRKDLRLQRRLIRTSLGQETFALRAAGSVRFWPSSSAQCLSEATAMRTRNSQTSIIGASIEATRFLFDSSRFFDSSLVLAVSLEVAV